MLLLAFVGYAYHRKGFGISIVNSTGIGFDFSSVDAAAPPRECKSTHLSSSPQHGYQLWGNILYFFKLFSVSCIGIPIDCHSDGAAYSGFITNAVCCHAIDNRLGAFICIF